MTADLVSLWVVSLRVRATCARPKPQHSLKSSGVLLECLFDDNNVLGKHISGTTTSCYWDMSSWSWANRIDSLSDVWFVSTTMLSTIFFACSWALSTLSITWDASSLRYWSWVHFLQWHIWWIFTYDWNRPYHVQRLLLGCTLCTLCIPLSRRILFQESTLRLSKPLDLPLTPAHHIMFVETEFDVDSNDVFT